MLPSLIGALFALGAAPSTAIHFSPSTPLSVASVSGRVRAIAGTPIADARIVVVEAGRVVMTDLEGHYIVPGILGGTYTLPVSAIGFAPQVRRLVVADHPVTQDFALKPSLVELPTIQVYLYAQRD